MSPDTEEKTIIKEAASVNSVSFKHELHTQYRLLRKKLSAYLRCRLKKPFINVLYITVEDVPAEYILSLQKQYPDKIIEVLILHTPERSNKANLIDKFEYQMKNNSFTCELYEYPLTEDNIKIYGISTDGFENLEQPSEIYQFKYLAHFSKCVRLAARKIKADIIHSENIPFYLGSEFCSENYSAKVFQTFHHYPMFANTEPFWAAINLADKKVLKRIINDKIIRKNLAALFGIRTPKGKSQTERCLDCFYKNFEDFRNNVDKDELVNENILIKRLNDRIIKMFPPAFPDNAEFFDIIYYSVNRSGYYGFYSSTDDVPEWITNKNILRKGYINTCNNKVFAPTSLECLFSISFACLFNFITIFSCFSFSFLSLSSISFFLFSAKLFKSFAILLFLSFFSFKYFFSLIYTISLYL